MNKTQFALILQQEGLSEYAAEQIWERRAHETMGVILDEGILRTTAKNFVSMRKRLGIPDKWFRTATRRECPLCLHQDHGHDPCPVLFCECQGQDFLFGGQPQ